MTIAIDYDGTFTRDQDFWRSVINSAIHRGHRVIIVTNRSERDKISLPPFAQAVPIYYCDRRLKEQHMLGAHGIKVDVWIDDMPGCIQETFILNDQVEDDEL